MFAHTGVNNHTIVGKQIFPHSRRKGMLLIYRENSIGERHGSQETPAEMKYEFDSELSTRTLKDLFFKKDLTMLTSCHRMLREIIFDISL